MQSFLRAAKAGFVDFARIVLVRTASDFDRAPPSETSEEVYFFNYAPQGGFDPATENIFISLSPMVNDIIENWHVLYADNHFKPDHYIGDVFGTLGGTPDFGPYN